MFGSLSTMKWGREIPRFNLRLFSTTPFAQFKFRKTRVNRVNFHKFIYSKSASNVARPAGRALNKRFTIQRRLAWFLCKVNTHYWREAILFLYTCTLPLLRLGLSIPQRRKLQKFQIYDSTGNVSNSLNDVFVLHNNRIYDPWQYHRTSSQ